jgi:dienelactone hydrolase
MSVVRSHRRRRALLAIVALAGAGCGTAATTAPTAAPGTTAVLISTPPPGTRVVALDLVDTSRTAPDGDPAPVADERELPTTVYLPEDRGPAPLIVLAHGFNGHPDKFTELATYWSEAGYVVAVPRFPLSSDETPEPVMTDIAGQGADVSFVIDEVLSRSARGRGPLAGRIDTERIGLFGLSLGSLSVWNTVLGDCCGDQRIDAVIQSDGYFPFPAELLSELTFPVMIAHSDTDFIFAYDEIRAQFDSLPDSAVLLTLHGALHAAVAENTVTHADGALQEATTVFWTRHLGADPDAAFPPEVVIEGVTTLEGDDAALPTTR